MSHANEAEFSMTQAYILMETEFCAAALSREIIFNRPAVNDLFFQQKLLNHPQSI